MRLLARFGAGLAELAGVAWLALVAAFVDLLGLAGFVAVVLGVLELSGRGWALVVAGALLLVAYALVEFILPLRLGRRSKRTED